MKKVFYFISVILLVLSYSLYTDYKVKNDVAPNESTEVLTKFPAKSYFQSLDGKAMTIENLKGSKREVYVHFWATWCPPCEKEMPDLVNFAKANSQDLFVLVAVNDDLNKVKQKFKEISAPENVVVVTDSQSFYSRLFGTYKLPETLHFSHDLNLLKRLRGAQPWTL